MSYFSNFRQQVINNIVADNVSQRYMDSIKKEINSKPKVKKVTKKAAKTSKSKRPSPSQIVQGILKEDGLKLSISKILKKVI